MPVLRLAEMTWSEVQDLTAEPNDRLAAILPVGAIEAHGPHLPLATDGVIAGAMAADGARRLSENGWTAVILETIDFTAAPFAAEFPGTVSIRPDTVTALVADIAGSLAAIGFGVFAIANAHLDPTHIASLERACAEVTASDAGRATTMVFPNIARKPWALRLTEEFKSGACHAGQFESSVVLAARPDLVRAERAGLTANPSSLSTAIRDGRSTFSEAGGPEAYFGDPANATAEEGRSTIATLGRILEEAVLAVA